MLAALEVSLGLVITLTLCSTGIAKLCNLNRIGQRALNRTVYGLPTKVVLSSVSIAELAVVAMAIRGAWVTYAAVLAAALFALFAAYHGVGGVRGDHTECACAGRPTEIDKPSCYGRVSGCLALAAGSCVWYWAAQPRGGINLYPIVGAAIPLSALVLRGLVRRHMVGTKRSAGGHLTSPQAGFAETFLG